MKNNNLTKKQEAILIYIKKYIAKNGFPPTVREIATYVNLSSPATVHVHLTNLIEKGYLKRNKKNKRMLELLVPNEFETTNLEDINIPLLQNNKKNTTIKLLKNIISKQKDLIAFQIDNNLFQYTGIIKNDILLFSKHEKITTKDIILINKNNSYTITEYNKNINNNIIIGKLIQLYRKY